MELHEALTQIAVIRRQIAGAEKFRGYRAVPVAIGGFMAFGAAIIQPILGVDPTRDLRQYLALWVAVALFAGALPAMDVWRRHRGSGSLKATLSRLAFEQFAPCVLAGGMITFVIAYFVPLVGWMLPGLWAVIFGLGLFASFRLLPGAIALVALWYLLTGCACLAVGPSQDGGAPWTMALTFGVGQLLASVILLRQDEQASDGQ